MDCIMFLLQIYHNYTAIVVFIDQLSKQLYLTVMRLDLDALMFAQIYFDIVFCHYRLFCIIVSNQDPCFTRSFWQALFKLLGKQLAMSIVFYPQTDEQIECANWTLEDML